MDIKCKLFRVITMALELFERESLPKENTSVGIFKASAPGSLMLFGEHAVLSGKKALVLAIDQRIHVKLEPRNDDIISVHSALGEYQTTISDIHRQEIPVSPMRFVLTAIKTYSKKLNALNNKCDNKLNKGFTLTIDSDFSHTVGFGSSAAVVVAVVRVLSKCYDDKPLAEFDLFRAAKKIIETVQGVGSGADVAASVFGGLVVYCIDPLHIKPLAILPPIKVVYSGYKTPTPDVIRQVQIKFEHKAEALALLYNNIEACTENALKAFESRDWQEVGQEMNKAHQLMKDLGVSDDILDQKAAALCLEPTLFGAKISGAGLGDCVIGIGYSPNIIPGELSVMPSLRGVDDV